MPAETATRPPNVPTLMTSGTTPEGKPTHGAWIPVEKQPRSKGNHKNIVSSGGRTFLVGNKSEQRFEKDLCKLLRSVAPAVPMRGVIRARVEFVMPIAKSWPKEKIEAALRGEWFPIADLAKKRSPVPDLGGLDKMLEDSLELGKKLKGGAWIVNDSQIQTRTCSKVYGEVAGYMILLVEERPEQLEWR